ncbi:hypothetical protein CW304_24130 [Bacillus sp. UFRGS-B20]|nr:hypothetical protein CW304_24130 [Bacillus sp. UFRGS-B20]
MQVAVFRGEGRNIKKYFQKGAPRQIRADRGPALTATVEAFISLPAQTEAMVAENQHIQGRIKMPTRK